MAMDTTNDAFKGCLHLFWVTKQALSKTMIFCENLEAIYIQYHVCVYVLNSSQKSNHSIEAVIFYTLESPYLTSAAFKRRLYSLIPSSVSLARKPNDSTYKLPGSAKRY